MANCKEYIDLTSKICRLIKDGKKETEECRNLLSQTEELWNKLTEEEQIYADEQTTRIVLYMGI
jgi:hypothetical protein